ncbi:MAG TPA: dienelactone hydrolase family protein [Pseudonocardiaceae bacterium]|jgi:carboxymethylenebutenolidase
MTKTRTETLPLADGSLLRLTVAEPETAVRGGIVVLHEARGVTDSVRALVSDLATEGWLAVAPHLYHRDGADEVAGERVADQLSRLTPSSVLEDSDAALAWLAARGVADDRIGVVGFDLGGAVAVKVATRRRVGAAVSVSAPGIIIPVAGQLRPLVEAAPELCCPWLGIYGGDAAAPVEEVEKLRDAAATAAVATDVVHYPAALDDDPDAAAEAWQRTLNWFDSHLR